MAVRKMIDAETGEEMDIDLEDPTETGPAKEERSNAEWAQLRKTTKERDDAQKALAFLKAGIDPDDPRMSYFVKGYDGKRETDAIKAAATEAGFLQAPAAATTDLSDVDKAALAAGQRISQAANGASPHTPTGTDALDDAFRQGGQDGMLAYMRAAGIPIKEQ